MNAPRELATLILHLAIVHPLQTPTCFWISFPSTDRSTRLHCFGRLISGHRNCSLLKRFSRDQRHSPPRRKLRVKDGLQSSSNILVALETLLNKDLLRRFPNILTALETLLDKNWQFLHSPCTAKSKKPDLLETFLASPSISQIRPKIGSETPTKGA